MLLRQGRPWTEVAAQHADVAARDEAASAIRRTGMPTDNVDHAADRVRAIERRPLRAPNDLDSLDRLWREVGDDQRVGDLDTIDIDLRVAGAERARAADA